MNPLTKVKLINELNEREAQLGIRESVSWHTEYRGSAWIFVGGFPYELTEGDLICVFSQYGEVVNINLVRDKKTGKSKGFCFICYEDQRSTVLAVDNFNGIKIKGRTIRVDHVKDYRPPKDGEDVDDVTKRLREDGCAPAAPPAASSSPEDDEQEVLPLKKPKKDKKEKKKKKKEKKKRSRTSSSSPPPAAVRVKEEKQDAAYDKYNHEVASPGRQRMMDTERGRWEEEGRKRGTDGDEDKWRNREREGRKREMNRDERWKRTDRAERRDDYRRQEMDRDDRRREKDRDDDRRGPEMRDRQKMERDEDRRRETDRR